ncbi:MAG: ribosomal RNA small subunit methyltransferase A [Deltaproteobacteria bacterium]|nr:ribosomal RNA small subunit methyltransferase A [Candidatus Zymogenaceae bacterium]
MTSLKDTLRQSGIFPYKGRGQHFLINNAIAEKIVALADLGPDDVVVEIGPGTGALTADIVRRAGRTVVIESDKKLASLIAETIGSDRLEVVFGDALRYDFHALGSSIGARFKVVANLPYNISTPLIFRLLDCRRYIRRIVLMLQKEVALRLTAHPGTKEYGVLTISASLFADISVALVVGSGNFYPRPKVDSAVVIFEIRNDPRADVGDINTFSRVVRAAFSNRRKTLRNALKPLLGSEAGQQLNMIGNGSGIDLGRRGETCSVEEFAVLARAVTAVTRGSSQNEQ